MEYDNVPLKVGKWMENFVVNDCILPPNAELKSEKIEGEMIYKVNDEVIFTHFIDEDNSSHVSFKEGMFTLS